MVLAVWTAILVFVWPLPNVITLRVSLLFGLIFFLVIESVRNQRVGALAQGTRLVLLVLAALAFWLCVVALWLTDNAEIALRELKGGWLRTFAAFFVGYLLLAALRRRGISTTTSMRLLFWALLSLAAIQSLNGLWHLATTGALPAFYGGIFDHKANITFVNAITASLLLADIATGEQSRRILGLNRITWLAASGLVLVTTYMSGARNGILVMLFLIFLGGIAYLRGYWHVSRVKLWLLVGTLIGFLLVGFWIMVKSDVRWTRFLATVPVAWDIDKSHSWIDIFKYPPPPAADGGKVEDTAYERISWARYAGRLISEHPLGTDLTRNSFRNLVIEKFGETRAAHSHNGYLDFTLAAGLPALALWVAFLIALARQGYNSFHLLQSGAGLALVLLVAGFAARSFLDSILRDHILEEFMFFAGLLLAASNRVDDTRVAADA
jgi:hypothetical protein